MSRLASHLHSKLLSMRNKRAFTLIELLVVILIIGLLIAVAAPSFLNQQDKAKDSEAKQKLAVAYKASKAAQKANDDRYGTPTELAGALNGSESPDDNTFAAVGAQPAEGSPSVFVSTPSGGDPDTTVVFRVRSGSGKVCETSVMTGNVYIPPECAAAVSAPDAGGGVGALGPDNGLAWTATTSTTDPMTFETTILSNGLYVGDNDTGSATQSSDFGGLSLVHMTRAANGSIYTLEYDWQSTGETQVKHVESDGSRTNVGSANPCPDGGSALGLTTRPSDSAALVFCSAWNGGGYYDYTLVLASSGSVVYAFQTSGNAVNRPSLSPDSSTVLYGELAPDPAAGGNDQGYIKKAALSGGAPTTLTAARPGDRFTGSPAYSPDGAKVVFMSSRVDSVLWDGIAPDMYVVNADGSGSAQVLATDLAHDGKSNPSFSNTGTRVAYVATSGGSGNALVYLDADGTGSPTEYPVEGLTFFAFR